jgi:hypothetical protein
VTTSDWRDTATSLLSQADRNLYTAKHQGRDRVSGDTFGHEPESDAHSLRQRRSSLSAKAS